MKLANYAALSLVVVCLSFGTQMVCAQSNQKYIVVRPSQEAAHADKQELVLNGVKTSPEAAGVRVFVDPGSEAKLDPQSKSYLGSVYFSHQKHPDVKEGSFVLPLSRKVAGPTKVVLYPVSSSGTPLSAQVEVQEARITAVDNSAFQ
jgi:hypothetical protein